MLQLAVSFCISVSTCAFAGGVGSEVLLDGGGPTWIKAISDLSESPFAAHARAKRRCWPADIVIAVEIELTALFVSYAA
jgi:hypothetical protein